MKVSPLRQSQLTTNTPHQTNHAHNHIELVLLLRHIRVYRNRIRDFCGWGHLAENWRCTTLSSF